ncbi:MAG: Fe-S protein assembly co-chaperone HscB [Bacteroidetes bacterium]|nr:Fe-S protein assembly co-chaperone HscB [Bacteroidota bacterium]MBU1373340.1 Fe-S protein assembly co-chaperone HscB [Bacteroidota bacterium]MBU1484431.1 Fe-S protein assembly co-chaperone HscB [Bacteroidota bacterium]MBU1759471.1 Fe-S protein assembly co-chaperone HscB [Bacteroidota bacterium]MBU2045252.1 Fe-S protein assembly co-chaperone HscB [Bacteroidota bacterium]
MDYFEFYDIPLSFQPDQALVKKKFYALSKAYHPDFFVTESEEKQQEILGLSTLNNKAFQTLSHIDKLLPYILTLKEVLTEGEKYVLPQDFLMEMMDVNEAIMELEMEEDEEQAKKVLTDVDDFDKSLNAEFQEAVKKFEQLAEQDQKALLLKIKDIWYRKKYLLRIRESINKFATRL